MPETLSDIGEFGLIDRIDALLRREGARVPDVTVGIGDDCAVFRPRPGVDILVTCDAMVEGRHYLPRLISPRDLGWRAMALNISDIGAMGGVPRYAMVSLGLRSTMQVTDLEAIYLGFAEALRPFHGVIIGGNITGSEGANIIDITLIGEIESGLSLRRSTAKPGDAILVTGYPGQAAAGLQLLLSNPADPKWKDTPLVQAYRRPSHRAAEGAAVAHSGLATAMIDISDGLIGDLGHICDESGVEAHIFENHLPVSPALREGARQLEKRPLDFLLGDSDDYELIITCLPEQVPEVRSLVGSIRGIPLTPIGEITSSTDGGTNIHMTFADGITRTLRRSGWDHFAH